MQSAFYPNTPVALQKREQKRKKRLKDARVFLHTCFLSFVFAFALLFWTGYGTLRYPHSAFPCYFCMVVGHCISLVGFLYKYRAVLAHNGDAQLNGLTYVGALILLAATTTNLYQHQNVPLAWGLWLTLGLPPLVMFVGTFGLLFYGVFLWVRRKWDALQAVGKP